MVQTIPGQSCRLDLPKMTANYVIDSKQRDGVYAVTQVNVMPIGQPQTISFQGQATHGGGACQISLTTDSPPTKDSVFKVIKSIEGGCPSTNPGNVGTDPFGFGADNFTFSIPDTIPAGKNYTLAWTWFNKIGDREMYMNCAPIIVPSSAQRRSTDKVDVKVLEQRNSMSSLPDMFRANIGSAGNGCSTAASGTVLAIPKDNIGSTVQRIGNEPLTAPIGNCGGTYGAASVPQAPAAPLSVQPVPPAKPSTTTIASVKPTVTTAAPPSVNPSANGSPPPPASPNPVGPASVPGLSTGTCPTPGKSVCSPDGTAWGTCDENHSVIYQKVAPNTKCDPSLGVEVHLKRGHVFRG